MSSSSRSVTSTTSTDPTLSGRDRVSHLADLPVPGLFSESHSYLPTPPLGKSHLQAPEPISESDMSPSRPHGKGHAREAAATVLPAPASPDLPPAEPATDRRLRLNIGGVVFETLQSTLCKYPDSLLGSMFHPRNHTLLKPDHRGEFFFDRNPKVGLLRLPVSSPVFLSLCFCCVWRDGLTLSM
jgi:hypothetical protein